ncbi:MAG: PilZ domain-containing protein [Pyrinomonadaceae bacterium]
MASISEQRATESLEPHLPLRKSPRRLALERRMHPRSSEPIAARLWGVCIHDAAFGVDCEIENISSTGLYVTVPCGLKSSSEARLVVRLSHSPDGAVTAGVRGRVLRVEAHANGSHGIALAIEGHKLL